MAVVAMAAAAMAAAAMAAAQVAVLEGEDFKVSTTGQCLCGSRSRSRG